ncbi:MAG TPA: hypothetical protein VGF94_00550 [Kofleriaceae bacterium]
MAFGCTSSSDNGSGQLPGLFTPTGTDCTQHTKLSFGVDESKAPPPFQLRIESCRMDADACMDLCTYELSNLPQMVQLFGSFEPPRFEGGGGGFGGTEPPVPNGPTLPTPSGLTPTACHVTFDGNTANSDVSFDSFSASSNCGFAQPGTNGGSATEGNP